MTDRAEKIGAIIGDHWSLIVICSVFVIVALLVSYLIRLWRWRRRKPMLRVVNGPSNRRWSSFVTPALALLVVLIAWQAGYIPFFGSTSGFANKVGDLWSTEWDKTPRAPKPDGSRKTLAAAKTTMAISGDRIVFNGKEMMFEGLSCPPPNTEEGRDAKALMNTFLRVGDVECIMTSFSGAMWRGNCLAEGADVAAAMKQSGLCR